MAVRAVFFDIGGVVARAQLERYSQIASLLFGAAPEKVRQVAQPLVPALEKNEIDANAFWQMVGEQLWIRGEGKMVARSKTESLWLDLLRSSVVLDVEVLQVCRDLKKRGVRIAALSNTIQQHAKHYRLLGVYRPFDPVLLSCEFGLRKPEPEFYQLALTKVGLPAQECLLVDDLQVNLDTARHLGFRTHHFTDLKRLQSSLARKGLYRA